MPRMAIGLLLIAAAMTGCNEGGSTAPPSDERGAVRLTLKRSPQSQLPPGVDSAIVRVWHPEAGLNFVRKVPVPAEDTATEVELEVPVGTGYSVGLIALRSRPGAADEALLGARADDVAVDPDQVTQIDLTLDIQFWELGLRSAPDILVSGTEATIVAEFTSGLLDDFLAPRFGATLRRDTALTAWLSPTEVGAGDAVGVLDGDSAVVTFTVPEVMEDDIVYFELTFGVDGAAGWSDAGVEVAAAVSLPAPILGDTLFSRPVRPQTGSIVVTFSEEQ